MDLKELAGADIWALATVRKLINKRDEDGGHISLVADFYGENH